MKSNWGNHRALLAIAMAMVSFAAYLFAAAPTERTFTWAPPLTLIRGQVLTAEPNGDGVFRLWQLDDSYEDKYGSGIKEVWSEDNWPDNLELVDLDGDGVLEVAAVIGALQGRKGPFTIWVNAYHQDDGGSFKSNSFWATSYYAPNYGGSLVFSSGTYAKAVGGNFLPEETGQDARDELIVAAGDQIALFAYINPTGENTPALTKLFQQTLPGTVRGLTSANLYGDDLDELVVLTHSDLKSTLQIMNVTVSETDNELTAKETYWSDLSQYWKTPAIGDTDGDGFKEIWVHSLNDPDVNPTGTLRAFEPGTPNQVPEIPEIEVGPYDRFTVGFVGGHDVIALNTPHSPGHTGNTARLITWNETTFSWGDEIDIAGPPSAMQITQDMLYITGFGNGGKTTGTFLLQVFEISTTAGTPSLSPLARRVGGARSEKEPTDLAVVP